MNPPGRHHYIPIFYLKRWAAHDGRVVEFSRPYGTKVKPRSTHPSGTGYVKHLYALQDLSQPQRQQVEELFMRPVDSLASEALAALESGARDHEWSPKLRSAWSRFIMSLMLRMPADIASLKAAYTAAWKKRTPKDEEKYASIRKSHYPPTFAEFLEWMCSEVIDDIAMQFLPSIIDHQFVGGVISNMHWFVLETDSRCHELITSDRPVVSTISLKPDNTFIMLPIGPRKAFWAVNSHEAESSIRRRGPSAVAEQANLCVVSQANKYAFARTDTCLPFISRHLSTEPKVSLFDRITQLQKQREAMEQGPGSV
jgi:hypothetical protein